MRSKQLIQEREIIIDSDILNEHQDKYLRLVDKFLRLIIPVT